MPVHKVVAAPTALTLWIDSTGTNNVGVRFNTLADPPEDHVGRAAEILTRLQSDLDKRVLRTDFAVDDPDRTLVSDKDTTFRFLDTGTNEIVEREVLVESVQWNEARQTYLPTLARTR